LGTTRSPKVPNLGCKEGVEPLWISGLSWQSHDKLQSRYFIFWHTVSESLWWEEQWRVAVNWTGSGFISWATYFVWSGLGIWRGTLLDKFSEQWGLSISR